MRAGPDLRWKLLAATMLTASLGSAALAEEARPVAEGATTGYELALHGVVSAELGHEIRLFGVAYLVDGLSTLRAGNGLEIEAKVTARQRQGNDREVVSRATANAGQGGRFSIAVPVAERTLVAPRLEITLRRPGQPGRTFEYGLQTQLPHQMDLLTDRRRYQPGEKVRVWTRVTSLRGGTPLARASVQLTLLDISGRPVAKRSVPTSSAGVATTEIELPDSAANGAWQVRAELTDGGLAPMANRPIEVTRRTVERLQASLELDQDLVRPGERLSGRVTVRTPSGAAVRGARVEIHIRGVEEPLILQSGPDGSVRFQAQAPSFLSGDVSSELVEARVVHPAHGTIRTQASYMMARVEWRVELTPAAGAVIPEIDHELFLAVSNPMGRPIASGTTIHVRGVGIPGGEVETTTDARGLAVVEMRLPRGAASRRQSGPCDGSVATSLEVEVDARPPVTARLCVAVAPEALVLPRVERGVVAPGGELEVQIQRRPEVSRMPILVEALWSGRAVAWTWVEGGRARGSLEIPANVRGLVEVRARPVHPSDWRRPLDEPGATAMGTGASTMVLVRPADSYALTVAPEHELWRVRERARVELRASRAPQQGWVSLLARDEAAHGGEEPWVLHWIRQELRAASNAGDDPDNARFLRTALAGVASPDSEQAEPPPLIFPPWQNQRSGGYSSGLAANLGVLRDPVARREELLRRGVAPVMQALEQAVARLGPGTEGRRGIVRERGRRVEFDPEVISTLIAARQLNRAVATTLGGELMTVAMITGADPSFTFDSVARRVARARLVTLLHALQQLADSDNPNAARAIAGEPPERWLSKLVQLGMIQPAALVDPWGRSFAFRRTTGGRDPAVVISERALDYELVSPGPDGVQGNGDDVRDPFERAVDQGTPYAVASGEDLLLERLSRIAPGPRVLEAMTQAYRRLGLAAQEEQTRGPVDATSSEDDMDYEPEPEAGEGGFGASDLRRARAEAPMGGFAMPAEDMMMDEAAEMPSSTVAMSPPPPPQPARPQAQPAPGNSAVAATLIREDFPATLFFVAEVPLDGQGRTQIEIPLADALTTYRLEAISWTASGWVTASSSRIRVDQEAMVDAPVPPFATVGDMIRLPVRVANRTDAPITARLEIASEGDLQLSDMAPRQAEVPPQDAVEVMVEVRLAAAGEGFLVIRATRADSGQPLDAVRRPLEVLQDARLARESREMLLEAGQRIRVDVPDEASPRGPGELRLAVGSALFGDPAVWGPSQGGESQLWAAWALAAGDRPVPEELIASVLGRLPDDDDDRWYWGGMEVALALSILWSDDRMSDAVVSSGLLTISENLPAESEIDGYVAQDDTFAWLLLALGPVLADARRRSAVAEDLELLEERLTGIVSSQAARATDAPVFWVLSAAALAFSGRGDDRALAVEMLRRSDRFVIEVGDEAWLEPPTTDGMSMSRVEPTALMALATLALGQERDAGLTLLRSLVRVARIAERWPIRARALATAAASRLASAPSDQVQISVDGRPVEVRREEGVLIAVLEDLGHPGRHAIDITMGRGEVALAWLDLRYGLPWSVEPLREAPVDLEWVGEVGPRDGRAGLLLAVRNRGARILTHPMVEIEVPAGAELDEPTRERLEELLVEPVTFEGRTMRLHLRPLAPGGFVRLPLPLRWSLGGTLIGLGTVFWDDRGPSTIQDLPVSLLPSRGVEISDRGDVPHQPEAEASPPPRPPPFPRPILPLNPLGLEVTP